VKLKPLTRFARIEPDRVSSTSRTIELTFSSETPVDRYFGTEILDHGGKVRLDRLNNAAPLLFNHNIDDVIGVVEGAMVGQDRRGHARVRFAQTARAEEVFGMVRDGILPNVSFAYRIHEATENPKTNEYRVTDFEPLEISIVTIPADPSIGVGRAFGDEEVEVRLQQVFSPAAPAAQQGATMADTQAAAGAIADVQVIEPKANPVEFETKRKQAIINLCKANKIDERIEREWIERGADLNEVADGIVAVLAERGRTNPQSVTKLDLSASEARRYSMMRALRAAANKSWDKAGLELECNKEISKRLNKLPRSESSFFVPLDVMMRDLPANTAKRDMTVAGVSGSNYLVSTDNAPGSFIDLLRNTSVSLRMGVTRLAGLQGNVTIPKMTAGNTAYWLADEGTQITESQPTIGQLSLSPKNVAALTELSHQLMQQSSPDAEQLVLTSIARDIGLAVDVGILRGSGASGQPTGIVNTGSIGAFTGTSLASPGVLDAQADVAAANALNPGCGYVTTPAVAALLMQRPELPSTGTERLWKGNLAEGSIFGFPAMSSAQMSSATMLFGWWPSVVLAEWGVLELMVNPYSDFTRGLTAVRGWYTCDVGVRYAGAWSYASSIT
jgi:HK97 family phage major capsid protein/HK97 family phage prohead protease